MLNIPARIAQGIVLHEPAQTARETVPENLVRVHVELSLVDEKQLDKVMDRAFFQHQLAVHNALSGFQFRVQQNLFVERGISQAQTHFRPRSLTAEFGLLATRADQRYPTVANGRSKNLRQNLHGIPN